MNQQDQQTGKRVVLLLGFMLFFSVMNVTMFNVAIPDIAKDLELAPSLAGWVITGYAMIYAIGSLMYGKLADLFPLKTLMTIGIGLLTVGSLIGFFLKGYVWLLVGRLVQSVGASSVPALVMIVPARYFPPEKRGAVMGVVASFIAFSAGVGPVVGGFVSGVLDWKYLFLLPIGTLLVLPFLRKALPNETRREGRIDVIGAGLLAASIAILMIAITNSSVGYAVVSALLLALFIVKSRKSQEPFISMSLFTEGPYRYAVASTFLTSSTGFSMMLVIPIMLKSMFNLTADAIGFVLFPAAMAAALLGRLGGKWTDRFGSIPMMLTFDYSL
jgi:DHA2 family metal-tetracycline-proton antiporter-like MFS transporter